MAKIEEITEDIQQASTADVIYKYSQTPYPAWIMSGLLLATPLVTSQPDKLKMAKLQEKGMSGFMGSAYKTKRIGPSPVSSLLFGSAMALGGWIINEGDVESGTGFITAWSTLYLIVNGRATFKGLRYGRVWPVMLSAVAGTNAYIHGKRFFFTSGTV